MKRLFSAASNFDSKISSVSLSLAELDKYEHVYMNHYVVSKKCAHCAEFDLEKTCKLLILTTFSCFSIGYFSYLI